jgi:biotin operon repressor
MATVQLPLSFERYAYCQKDFIRKVLIGAKEAGTWLSLEELGHLTNYGEASISAQLRNLRKDGFIVSKRIRKGQTWYLLGIELKGDAH